MKASLGGSYVLTGIGVGLAFASWGTSALWASLYGLLWPITLAYEVMRTLHHFAGG
jgi:hypothetical protein